MISYVKSLVATETSFGDKVWSVVCSFNYFNFFMDILKAIIILLITKYIVEKIVSRVKNDKNLSDYGITRIKHHDSSDDHNDSDKGSGNLSRHDIALLFGRHGNPKPKELCFFFITGYTFFGNYLKESNELLKLAQGGCKIKILVGNYRNCKFAATINKPDYADLATDYYYNIAAGKIDGQCFLDRSTAMVACKSSDISGHEKDMKKKINGLVLSDRGDHLSQILKLNEMVRVVNEQITDFGNKIEVRFFEDEYRFPFMIAKYDAKKDSDIRIRVWSNYVAPIQEARKSINLYGEAKEGEKTTFTASSELSFDYLWNRYEHNSLK